MDELYRGCSQSRRVERILEGKMSEVREIER
jgi:hypothetical protein